MRGSQVASFLSQIDRKIENPSVLDHDFYLRWQEGRITDSELEGFQKELSSFESALGESEAPTDYFHNDETEFLSRTFRRFAVSQNPIERFAARYAYERQQRVVFRKGDAKKAEAEGQRLLELCRDEASRARALEVVEQTSQALREFLDGIERRYPSASTYH